MNHDEVIEEKSDKLRRIYIWFNQLTVEREVIITQTYCSIQFKGQVSPVSLHNSSSDKCYTVQ